MARISICLKQHRNRILMSSRVEIDGVGLHLGRADQTTGEWIGQHEAFKTVAGLLAGDR